MLLLALVAQFIVIQMPFASAAVSAPSAITVVDTDTTSPGVSGSDFHITFTPPVAGAGESFQYGVYIINGAETSPSAINDLNNLTPVMINIPSNVSDIVLPDFIRIDSGTVAMPAGESDLVNGNYKVCIVSFVEAPNEAESKVACSASTAITADIVADTVGPFINFFPAHSMITGTDAAYNMIIRDAQTASVSLTTTLVWGDDISNATESDILCGIFGQSRFTCTIPWDTVNGAGLSGSDFEYYIKSVDTASPPNTTYFCANPTATTDAACKASPLTTTIIAAGSRTVSGLVSESGAGGTLASASVFPAGYAIAAVETINGAYTISGLPNNTAVDIMAYKQGYCESTRFETIGTSNLINIDLNLPVGECVVSNNVGPGGSGGGSGKPHRVFSSPPEFDNFAPIEANILVGFDQSLNPANINDSDASNAGSNVYLSTFSALGSETKVAGAVTYCATNESAGCSSLMPGDMNVILFNPTENLTANTTYNLVVTEAVTSNSGSSIEGNRPGGGLKLTFTAGGGTISFNNNTFGTGGQYMPPFAEAVMPGPGIASAPNTNIMVKFNESMDTATLTTNNLLLLDSAGAPIARSISVSSDNKTVIINPDSNLSAGEYQIQILGAVANASGITMRAADQSASSAFTSFFNISGSADATAPTVYPFVTNGSTDVGVNQGKFEYGFNEPMNPTTMTTSNITMLRGNNSVPFNVTYSPGSNNLFVNPTNVLAPNTTYTITLTTSVTDLAGVALAANNVVSFTTGASDTVKPDLREGECDNYSCFLRFSEPMNSSTLVDGADEWALSIINPDNLAMQVETTPGSGTYGSDLITADTPVTITYDSGSFAIHTKGLALSPDDADKKFKLTVTSAADLSDNVINTVASANILIGKLQDNRETFGAFNGGGGMFGPPKNFFGEGADGTAGGEFKPAGFGDFTAEQFSFGQADMAFPFNMTAGQDVNVFQTRFTPGVVLADNDVIELTFPTGTIVTDAAPDSFSPFFTDMNEFAPGVIGLDTVNDATYGTNGLSAVNAARTVSVQLNITGTPDANSPLTFDLRKITNPSIPRGPGSAGYTVGIKVKRSGETIVDKTSMPYFIQEGGSRSITVNIYAGSADTPVAGANGDIFLFGGGPSGPMDKNVTLADGIISAVDDTSLTAVTYTGLNDGCYFFGTEPFVSLGDVDYFGKHSPEPVCVDSGTPSATKNIVLAPAEGDGVQTYTVTVKLAGIADFGGANIDIFAGGPGSFISKQLTVGVPNAGGYTLRLPSAGQWMIGVGPGMNKGPSTKMPDPLPGVAPPPMNIKTSTVNDSPVVTAGFVTPPGVSFNDDTDTLTFTFAAADKDITGTVTDGSTGLANVEVMMHSQGFGTPTSTRTATDGSFTLSVSNYGPYEIGVFKDGMNPRFDQIDVKADGADVGDGIDIFFKGKQITNANPLVLTVRKPAYTISGKILDASSNGVAYAPVHAQDESGNFVGGGTSSDGSYTLFVSAGTWTVKADMPPDKTDVCGTYSKTVVVTTESKSSQNVSPTEGTCYTLSGTVTIAGSAYASAPVFIEEWNTETDRPAGGMFRPSSTDANGVYTTKVGNGTYRVGIWTPDYGEISTTTTVSGSNVTNAHVTTGTTADITFSFTGGSATHEAFIEVKNSSDRHVRFGKNQQGLTSDVVMTMKEGTYNYFVNVFGVGDFTGTVATGATATINLSTTNMITLSGHVDDTNEAALSGAFVTVKDSTGFMQTATTDANGNYTMRVKEGTYTVKSSLAGYVPTQAPETATIAADTTYDFATAGDQSGLAQADSVIEGTVYQSDGTSPVTTGFVTAVNSDGISVAAPINPVDGTYSIPVTDDTWTVKGVAPNHAKTTKDGTTAVSGADEAGVDITLAADETKATTSASGALAANVGGTIDDTDNSGIKITAGSGVLETGSGNVTVNTELSYDAPDTDTLLPLGDAAFDISATGSSEIKNLAGNAEITLDYTDLLADLPEGVSESDLKLVYFSPQKGEYVPVEGGASIDPVNNTITGVTNHFTTFAIVYSPPPAAAAVVVATPSGGGGGGGGILSLLTQTVKKSVAAVAVKVVTSLSANVVDDKYVPVGTEGKVVEEVSLRNLETKSFYTVAAGTDVTDTDGKKYVGDLTPPAVSTSTAKSPVGLNIVSDVFDIKADKSVKFSKPVTVVLPVNATVTTKSKVNVYYLDEVKNSWKLLSAGTVKVLDGKNFVEFATDHFTKFVVMQIPNFVNFKDVNLHWAKQYIDKLNGLEILKGYADGTFKPDNNVTRAEFAKIVVEAFGVAIPEAKDVSKNVFSDVPKDAWHWKYVYAAYNGKIVVGFKDNTFMPDKPVNRAEALKMLFEAAGTEIDTSVSTSFEDVFSTSWFGKYVSHAVKQKLVQGFDDQTFRPGKNMSRGEVAKLVSLLLDMKK